MEVALNIIFTVSFIVFILTFLLNITILIIQSCLPCINDTLEKIGIVSLYVFCVAGLIMLVSFGLYGALFYDV